MNVPLGAFSFAYEAKAPCGVTVTVTVTVPLAGTVTESAEYVRSMPCPAQFLECSVNRPPSTISESAWPPRAYVWSASETFVRVTWKVHPFVPSPRSALGRHGFSAPATLGYTVVVVAASASTWPAPTRRGE